MFARVKKSGKYQYLQVVENRKIKGDIAWKVPEGVGVKFTTVSKEVGEMIKSL